MSTKIVRQKDLFEKGQRQKSSMAAVSEMHAMFDMDQTDTMKHLQQMISRSENQAGKKSVYSEELEEKQHVQETGSTQSNQLTEQMYQQIHDIGYKAAQDVYERKLRDIQSQVKNSDDIVRQMDQAYKETLTQMQFIRNEFENTLNSRAKEIIIRSCEKVLQTHLKDEAFVTDYLKTFINQFKEEQDVILRLSPDMYSRVEASFSMLESINPKIKLHIATDPTMQMFGCVIETENQRLDLQLDNQLNNLKNLIEGL